MADYTGFITGHRQSDRPYHHFAVGGVFVGKSRLTYSWDESGSGSYPSGDYPSGVAAYGVPVIEIAPGGYAVMYVALEAGQSVSVPCYAAEAGKCGLRLVNRIGPVLATDYSASDNEWENLVVALPSGYATGIYLVEVVNFAFQNDGDARAYFGPLEVVT